MKGLIDLSGLPPDAVSDILGRASHYADLLEAQTTIDPILHDKVVTNAFFEASTRTRLSFERASMALGADVLSLDPEISSAVKGESLGDTLQTLAALGTDVLVLRHGEDDAPAYAANVTGLPVINAGAGTSMHPTQTLLDLLTIRRHFGRFEGLRLAIVGDIAHSRVAAGLIEALPSVGVDLRLVGPDSLLPGDADVPTTDDLDGCLGELDIVYLLRLQRERGTAQPSFYTEAFQMNSTRSARLNDRAVVMHPGPINRGIEITDDVADGPRSLILQQVANGVPTRMAVLEVVAGEAL